MTAACTAIALSGAGSPHPTFLLALLRPLPDHRRGSCARHFARLFSVTAPQRGCEPTTASAFAQPAAWGGSASSLLVDSTRIRPEHTPQRRPRRMARMSGFHKTL